MRLSQDLRPALSILAPRAGQGILDVVLETTRSGDPAVQGRRIGLENRGWLPAAGHGLLA
jgi:hypothetical protein